MRSYIISYHTSYTISYHIIYHILLHHVSYRIISYTKITTLATPIDKLKNTSDNDSPAQNVKRPHAVGAKLYMYIYIEGEREREIEMERFTFQCTFFFFPSKYKVSPR